MTNEEIIYSAKKVFDTEIEALNKLRDSINEVFCEIVNEIIACSGKVIITGMGKPGHIATKLAATFSSLGVSSFFLHPAEALHGDLGMVASEDIVLAISYSGESDEIIKILPSIKIIGAKLIGITKNQKSTLAKFCDIVQILPEFEEACHLKLAPTSSTTSELVYGDALAVVASQINGFTKKDFGVFHPAGALGKKLVLKVSDLMITGDSNAIVNCNMKMKDAIVVMSEKGLGFLSVVDEFNRLVGVITDGDLRRGIEKNSNIYTVSLQDIMTTNPKYIDPNTLAVNALKSMNDMRITSMPVLDDEKRVIGTIRMHDILKVGIAL